MKSTLCWLREYLSEELACITEPSLDQLNFTSGAPFARQVNLAVSPTLAAALASTGDRSVSGLSERKEGQINIFKEGGKNNGFNFLSKDELPYV